MRYAMLLATLVLTAGGCGRVLPSAALPGLPAAVVDLDGYRHIWLGRPTSDPHLLMEVAADGWVMGQVPGTPWPVRARFSLRATETAAGVNGKLDVTYDSVPPVERHYPITERLYVDHWPIELNLPDLDYHLQLGGFEGENGWHVDVDEHTDPGTPDRIAISEIYGGPSADGVIEQGHLQLRAPFQVHEGSDYHPVHRLLPDNLLRISIK